MSEPVPLERVQQLERDLRTRLHRVDGEIAIERGITRDLVEALHVRMDNNETTVLNELRAIRAMIAALGANGSNGHG